MKINLISSSGCSLKIVAKKFRKKISNKEQGDIWDMADLALAQPLTRGLL